MKNFIVNDGIGGAGGCHLGNINFNAFYYSSIKGLFISLIINMIINMIINVVINVIITSTTIIIIITNIIIARTGNVQVAPTIRHSLPTHRHLQLAMSTCDAKIKP